jgi:hypothetical protein
MSITVPCVHEKHAVGRKLFYQRRTVIHRLGAYIHISTLNSVTSQCTLVLGHAVVSIVPGSWSRPSVGGESHTRMHGGWFTRRSPSSAGGNSVQCPAANHLRALLFFADSLIDVSTVRCGERTPTHVICDADMTKIISV